MTYLKTYWPAFVFFVVIVCSFLSSERSEPTPPKNDTVWKSYSGDSIYGVEVKHSGIKYLKDER